MATLDTIATRFARCVELFRDPGAKDAQKAEFRVLLGLLQELPVTLTVAAGHLELNGVPCEAAALTRLIQRLDLHGVGTITLPQNPAPGQLFELLRALADQPGLEDFATRLGGSGAAGIRRQRHRPPRHRSLPPTMVSAPWFPSSLPPMPPGPRCRRWGRTASCAAKRCGTFGR